MIPHQFDPTVWGLGVLAVVSAATCIALPIVVFWLAFG